MTSHPLENYFNLIENRYLGAIHAEFHDIYLFKSSLDPTLFDDHEILWDNDENCYIQKSIKDNKIVRQFTFDEHLDDVLSGYFRLFRQQIREDILDKSDAIVIDYAKNMQREIPRLMRISSERYKEHLHHLLNALKNLDTFLIDISGGTFIKTTAKSSAPNNKIQWLGNLNLLGTLFYELQSGSNNLKKKLIKTDRQELTKFIVNNFIDKDGHPLSRETIYTYLDSQKPFKRSKDSIYLTEENSSALPK